MQPWLLWYGSWLFLRKPLQNNCNTLQLTAIWCDTWCGCCEAAVYFNLMHCCSILQRNATHCNPLKSSATHCTVVQHAASHYIAVQRVALHYIALQHVTPHFTFVHARHAAHCNKLAAHRNTRHRTASHCNNPYSSATHDAAFEFQSRTLLTKMSHITHIYKESHHTYEGGKSHVLMNHAWHIDESRCTYDCVMSHI